MATACRQQTKHMATCSHQTSVCAFSNQLYNLVKTSCNKQFQYTRTMTSKDTNDTPKYPEAHESCFMHHSGKLEKQELSKYQSNLLAPGKPPYHHKTLPPHKSNQRKHPKTLPQSLHASPSWRRPAPAAPPSGDIGDETHFTSHAEDHEETIVAHQHLGLPSKRSCYLETANLCLVRFKAVKGEATRYLLETYLTFRLIFDRV